MRTAAEIREGIRNGSIKKAERTGKGPGEGIFECAISTAEIGIGEKGTVRGKIVATITGAEDTANVGKKINIYVQTINDDYLVESIAEYAERCAIWGIREDRIYDRADTAVDVMGNILIEMNRLALKGQLTCVLERKASGKVDPNGNAQYWTNWLDVGTNVGSVTQAGSEVAQAAPVAEPMAPAPVAAAPALAPALTAPAPRKPWVK